MKTINREDVREGDIVEVTYLTGTVVRGKVQEAKGSWFDIETEQDHEITVFTDSRVRDIVLVERPPEDGLYVDNVANHMLWAVIDGDVYITTEPTTRGAWITQPSMRDDVRKIADLPKEWKND